MEIKNLFEILYTLKLLMIAKKREMFWSCEDPREEEEERPMCQ